MTTFRQCCAQVRPYAKSTTTRQCERAARLVAFVPDDKGDAARNGVRGFLREFCGLHDPERAARRQLPAPITDEQREVTFQGRTVRLTWARAAVLARMFIKASNGRAGLMAYDCRDVLDRWAEDDKSAASQPRSATLDDVKNLFG